MRGDDFGQVPDARQAEARELQIQGMTCAACVRRVERALTSVPGVSEATVNLVTERALVRFDPGLVDGAKLLGAVSAAGYEAVERIPREAGESSAAGATQRSEALAQRELKEDRTLRRNLVVSAVLTVPLLVIGMSHGAMPGIDTAVGHWAQLALATIVLFGPGWRFLRLGWKALRHLSADMNTLVSIGAIAAWAYSTAGVVGRGLVAHAEHGPAPHLYFEATGAIISFVLFGKWLETRARKRLSDAVRGLIALVPEEAVRVSAAGVEERVQVDALTTGQVVLVRPGERVPTDGIVVRGNSAIDESTLTGESMPVDKASGDKVFAGTLNQTGVL